MRCVAFFLLAAASALAAPRPSPRSHPRPPPGSELLKIRVGPDSNACGITAPKSRGPAGVILWLHGGMRSPNLEKGWEAHRPLLGFVKPGAYYLCSPSAYAGADWLTPEGMAHIDGLLDELGKRFPAARLDKLIVVGVSDGCLGALRYAKLGKRTPVFCALFSSFPALAVEEEELLRMPPYTSLRWEVFQGGRDRLFPPDVVFPLLRRWSQANAKVALHLYPEGEHDFSWFAGHADREIRALF